MPWHLVGRALEQACDARTVRRIYFEGGEPFLYYATLLRGVQMAAALGFHVGIVSNGYWAIEVEDALGWLRPLAGLIQDLSISSDLYHWDETLSRRATNARVAAERLGIPIGIISIAQPDTTAGMETVGQLPPGASEVMYRGRAAANLAPRVTQRPWTRFSECPHENLREPGRVHLDPLGNIHVCQGILLGNILQTPLKEICADYDPDRHPIVEPLLNGGPAGLATRYSLPHQDAYADACHLCDDARRRLRHRFPGILAPDQMYGVAETDRGSGAGAPQARA
jgi:hypothetical protein